MLFSEFEKVLLEEALGHSPSREASRPRITATNGEHSPQVVVSVDNSYSEFLEQIEQCNAGYLDWQLTVAQLASLGEDELRALRRVAAQHLHPDRPSNKKNAADLLAVINADIDQRLKTLLHRSRQSK